MLLLQVLQVALMMLPEQKDVPQARALQQQEQLAWAQVPVGEPQQRLPVLSSAGWPSERHQAWKRATSRSLAWTLPRRA